jgi:hypothetical protein
MLLFVGTKLIVGNIERDEKGFLRLKLIHDGLDFLKSPLTICLHFLLLKIFMGLELCLQSFTALTPGNCIHGFEIVLNSCSFCMEFINPNIPNMQLKTVINLISCEGWHREDDWNLQILEERVKVTRLFEILGTVCS